MVYIKWLKSAQLDLKDIYDYITHDSKRYAQLQIVKIQTKTEIIKSNIFIGKIVREANNINVREITEGNYRIIYRIISENEIHILMIHHGARYLLRRI
ncbi:type II toxin-antitoxin system RelE/ParE family toxin [Epilithonimonas caeni]|uniref:type II toxin-antitoxin system RelE/ParE family toxin n=1 Tax=Epilithonimonas caeni TaxID=365343 RepID=UPI0004027716|nr:type II toxin-antitoxin system RelE/ParE family toxin [Epilithonimonas caeni]